MIRKFGGVDVPPGEVRRILLDIESWPEFMPGIRSARILERSKNRIVAEVGKAEFGTVTRTKREFLPNPSGYFERQLTGMALKWEGDWRVVESPSGRGSTLSCDLEIDLGFYGIFMPGRMVQRAIDRTFERILRGIERHARRTSPGTAIDHHFRDKLLGAQVKTVERVRLFATPTGLELWLDDRKYTAHRSD